MINVNSNLQESDLNIENYTDINISLLSDEILFEDSYPDTNIIYTLQGNQVYKGIISDNTCIKIPLDIETCNDCSTIDLTLFSDIVNDDFLYNGNIQIIKDIPLYINNEFENDNTGPLISLSQEGSAVNNGSIINKGLQITITLEDEQGINLMNDFQHNVRYWFNNETYIYNLNSNLFEYDESSCGKTSANFFLPEGLESGSNSIHIEAWDNGNNRTLLNYNFSNELRS